MTLFNFPGVGSKEGEWWLLTAKGQMVHVTGAVNAKHVDNVAIVRVQNNGVAIRDELLAYSNDMKAATKAAR